MVKFTNLNSYLLIIEDLNDYGEIIKQFKVRGIDAKWALI